MDNLINDIRNVFKNQETTKYPILKQGREFIKYNEDYIKVVEPELKFIQKTSSPNLSSIVETLESNNSLSQNNKAQASKVSKYENEFNRTLAEYTNTYKHFMQELLNKNQTQKNVNQYFGKVISGNDGNYAYVNDFGYTHRYSNDAWLKNDKTCPNTVLPISADDFKLMNQGPDMGIGQACKIAGQNIQNTDTDEIAWVDIKGFKHIYPAKIWENKIKDCDISPIKISGLAYNNISSGTPMNETSVCSQMDVNPVLLDKLNKLNNQLISLAKSMIDEINNISVNNTSLKDKLTYKKEQLTEHINNFNHQKNLSFSGKDFITIQGEEENSLSYLNYNYYNYLWWCIFIILIILFILFRGTIGVSDNLETFIILAIVIIMGYYLINKTIS